MKHYKALPLNDKAEKNALIATAIVNTAAGRLVDFF